ncbi:MAG: type II toxin-antitoxin system VapC family toxin [Gammaproteobacteria bacterium]|nr:type II toxin-antitoxin system VapC family toxin [Gammaproteobacteria bacterium]
MQTSTMNEFLLDTCTIIWKGNNGYLHSDAIDRLNRNYQMACSTYVSPISAWELGMLCARGRIRLDRPAEKWFEEYMYRGQYRLAEMSPRILIESSYLPGTPPVDPADRIIIATARLLHLEIVTRDRMILEYANKGYVHALRC